MAKGPAELPVDRDSSEKRSVVPPDSRIEGGVVLIETWKYRTAGRLERST